MKRAIKKNVKTAQMKHEIEPVHKTDEVVLFQSKDGSVSLPVPVDGKTVWLTQSQMAQLFGKDKTVVARHIRNAISEGEIDPKVVYAKFAHTTRLRSVRSISRSAAKISIRPPRRRRRIFSISSRRTMASSTATSVLRPRSSSIFWNATGSCCARTARSASPITRSSR